MKKIENNAIPKLPIELIIEFTISAIKLKFSDLETS